MRILPYLVILSFSINVYANQGNTMNKQQETSSEQTAVLLPINNMFDAMREHNGEKLLAQFVQGAMLERANSEDKIENSDLSKFAETVATSKRALDEQIFNITVTQSGNLASVWTPFAFYLDGKLSHCGVNSFQLIKQQGQWKIRYLIDNGYQGDCETFIAEHKAVKS